MNYIPLNVKTHYELLSSLIKIDELCLYLKSNSINAVGITDSNMFGTMELFKECNKYNIKPIVGVYFEVQDFKMLLYAKNYDGYVNLLNLVSIRNTSEITLEVLKKHIDGIICVTKDYDNFFKYFEVFSDLYLCYSNNAEKTSALVFTDKVVYLKESLYIEEDDKEYLMYLNMIRDSKTIDDKDNYSYDNALNYMVSESDSKTTYEFASLIDIVMPEVKYELPKYSSNSDEVLTNLAFKGLNKRLSGNVSEEYLDRINMELDVIKSMHFSDYFLIVYDFILYAKKNKIVIGPGRGSACASLVSYSLGITEIDPLKYDLIFERFLNKDRVTMPDIDTDIEYLRRDEVVNYVKEKYGMDKVSNIITFGTLQIKAVLRDVGRVLNMPGGKIDYLIKSINLENSFKETIENDAFNKLVRENKDYAFLVRICKRLEGFIRHTSVHAAGVIISDKPLMDKVPIYNNGYCLLSGYTMGYLENLGLLKIDFLALKNLTIVDKVLKKVQSEKGIYININKLPTDDKRALGVFYNANTTGIFQFESSGMMQFLKALKVDSFDDVISAIALYRPGPRDMIPKYINIKFKREKPTYIVSELESILKSTNGIIIYQEQIIEILKKIGSFTYSEADIIRRAMSKKKEEAILMYREKFVTGAINNGVSEDKANQIYDLVLKFANYGFNKGHSVAYAYLAYSMAYLKAYFPEYFMTTILDMVTHDEVKTNLYINEAKKFKLDFIFADINKSSDIYIIIDKTIYLPFTTIKNVGKESVNAILKERENGEFTSFIDFFKRMFKRVKVNVIESLIYAGALDSFGLTRRTMIQNISSLTEYAKLLNDLDESLVSVPEIINYEEYDENELYEEEIKSYGFYIENHPVTKYNRDGMCLLCDISKQFDKMVNALVLVESAKEIETKKKDKMVFLTVSDETARSTLVIFPNMYKEYVGLKKGDVIKARAKVEKRMGDYQLIANKLEKM